MAEFNSQYTGTQIDAALQVIIDSNISVQDLIKIIVTSNGTAEANKAAVLDSNKDFSGLRNLTASQLAATLLLLDVLNDDPAETPPVGKMFIYVKNGVMYSKNELDVVAQVTGGGKGFQHSFTSESVVTVNHNLNDQYPLVQAMVENLLFDGEVDFVNVNSLTVTFASPRSGVIKCVTF